MYAYLIHNIIEKIGSSTNDRGAPIDLTDHRLDYDDSPTKKPKGIEATRASPIRSAALLPDMVTNQMVLESNQADKKNDDDLADSLTNANVDVPVDQSRLFEFES